MMDWFPCVVDLLATFPSYTINRFFNLCGDLVAIGIDLVVDNFAKRYKRIFLVFRRDRYG